MCAGIRMMGGFDPWDEVILSVDSKLPQIVQIQTMATDVGIPRRTAW